MEWIFILHYIPSPRMAVARSSSREVVKKTQSQSRYLHSYENRHVPRGIQFPRGGSQVSNRVIPNYYVRPVILGRVKERASWVSLAKSREQKNREEVDRCGCQAALREECEIRVLLREARGRFKERGTYFAVETIFAFAYITSHAYTLRCRISCSADIIYIYTSIVWERNISASTE